MKESVRLGRVAGVEIGFNWSLIVVAVLLALGLAQGRLPSQAPGYPKAAYAVAGALTALAFLAGVLAHELSHAMVARHEGLEVDGIVLWLMGGVTRINGDSATPGAELRISGVGPLVSLLIGLAFGIVQVAGSWMGVGRLWDATFGWLAVINVVLAAFNLLPGAPLDGGRVFHAWLWRRSGDRLRSTRTVSHVGRGLGGLLVGLGLVEFSTGRAGFEGLWLVLVGWFLMSAAGAEAGSAQLRQALDGVKAADLMTPWPMVGPGWLTVQAFLDDYASRSWQPAWLVEQWGGGLAGLVPVAALRAVPWAQRPAVRVIDLAIPVDRLPVTRPDEPALDVLVRMNEQRSEWAVVVDADRVVGIISGQAVSDGIRRGDRSASDLGVG